MVLEPDGVGVEGQAGVREGDMAVEKMGAQQPEAVMAMDESCTPFLSTLDGSMTALEKRYVLWELEFGA